MKKIVLGLLGVVALIVVVSAFALTRDGELVTPVGNGTVEVGSESFEAFPLPDYAADFVDQEYKSYLVEVEPGIKIHILEVGSGYPVYMQHGAPTSGFLYRQVAEELPLDQFRVIMPTMVGLGFSSKVPASQHTLENHTRWMNEALNQLAIEELIYIGHDWGGPVGMGALVHSPDMLQGAVILNTVFDAPTESGNLSTPLRVLRTPILGEFLAEGLFSLFTTLPTVQVDPASISDDVVELYQRPLQDSDNEKGPLAIVRMSANGPDHPTAAVLREIEVYIQGLDVPSAIVWGSSDPILATRLPAMINHFPEAQVTEVEAGHFLQEEGEGPETIAAAVQDVYRQIQASNSE